MNWMDAYVFTPSKDGEYLVQIGRSFHTADYINKTWKIHGSDEKRPDMWADVNLLADDEDLEV